MRQPPMGRSAPRAAAPGGQCLRGGLEGDKVGNLVRPTACEQCGTTGVKIDAAHSDYMRPLDVRWLCRRCHVMWDIAEPKTKTA